MDALVSAPLASFGESLDLLTQMPGVIRVYMVRYATAACWGAYHEVKASLLLSRRSKSQCLQIGLDMWVCRDIV